jgi:hypothetical protein
MTFFPNSFPSDAGCLAARIEPFSIAEYAAAKLLPHSGPWMF